MALSNEVDTQDVREQRQLGIARRRRLRCHSEDRAVAFVEADRAVGVDGRARQVALLVLDDRELPDPCLERRAGRNALVESGPDLAGDQSPPTAPIAARRPAARAS